MVDFKAVHKDYQQTADARNLDDRQKNRDDFFYTDERRHFKNVNGITGMRVDGCGTVGTRPIPDMTIRHNGVRIRIEDADWVSGEYVVRIAGDTHASATVDADGLRGFLSTIAEEGNLTDAWTVAFSNIGE